MRRLPTLCAPLLAVGLAVCAGCGSAPATGESAEAQLEFGVQMARRQLWNEALFRFRQAARMDPNNPRIFNNLAIASEAVGNFEEALDYYQKALRLAPTDRVLKGNYTRFVEFYQSFKPEEPEDDSAGESGGEDAGGAASAQSSSGAAS